MTHILRGWGEPSYLRHYDAFAYENRYVTHPSTNSFEKNNHYSRCHYGHFQSVSMMIMKS